MGWIPFKSEIDQLIAPWHSLSAFNFWDEKPWTESVSNATEEAWLKQELD